VKRALVIDADPHTKKLLGINLGRNGYDVYTATSGCDELHSIRAVRPDIVLFELKPPDSEGSKSIADIRSWSSIPVIALSVRGPRSDVVALLGAGADDYLAIPFNVRELLARMNATFRRTLPASRDPVVACGELKVNLDTRYVSVGEREVLLTPTEYAILAYLARNCGKVVTKDVLLKELWGPLAADRKESLRFHIFLLREKIEGDASRPVYIITEPGVGYKLSC
jgi:two-component system KDP operon response regulator KdpE